MKQKRSAFFKVFRLAFLLMLGLLTACAGEREVSRSGYGGDGGYYKVGRPYKIKGQVYTPQEDYSYDETGIASWYGSDFHNQKTANGEIFNKNELTAAHKTLPMPSLARVTNLENGRAIVVRINDRGPFAYSRIIDLSQRSAQLLGFERQGTAKVRVQVLADESKAIAEAMRRYGSTPDQAVAAVQSQPAQQKGYVSASSQPVSAQPLSETIASVKPVPTYTQLPVTGAQDLYVQAGAFTQRDNAMRLKNRLSRVGQTKIVEAVVKSVLYYRVRVGPVRTVAQADMLLKNVLGAGIEGARIIVD